MRGRYNSTNLSRYSPYHEQSIRRHLTQAFPWARFNAALLQGVLPQTHELMLAQDASFIPKCGSHTTGLGHFYNGCAQRVEKGLELSLISVVDLTQNTAYALHAQQTLAHTEAKTEAKTGCKDLRHLQATQEHWPLGVTYLAVDGAYARCGFVAGALEMGLHVVSRLRCNANVRYLYTGEQKPRGRRRLYDGKVHWDQLDVQRWNDEGELEPGVRLYSATLNHLSLGRDIKVALLVSNKASNKTSNKATRQVLLFCTDLQSCGRDIVRRYRARFQIEFLFRDAKSGAGLLDCQSRTQAALDFSWNCSFAALNLAKLPLCGEVKRPFSWASLHQKQANEHLLQRFCSNFHLDWSWVISQPHFLSLVNYGVIAP